MLGIADEARVLVLAADTGVLYLPMRGIRLRFLADELQYLGVGNVEFVELFAESGRADGKVAVKVDQGRELDLAVFGVPYYEVVECRVSLNDKGAFVYLLVLGDFEAKRQSEGLLGAPVDADVEYVL